jgi:hypothetical protein
LGIVFLVCYLNVLGGKVLVTKSRMASIANNIINVLLFVVYDIYNFIAQFI